MIDDINKVIENDNIILHRPNHNELRYREILHKDSTIKVNDLEYWYNQMNSNMRNYYAYIVSKDLRRFVGEVMVIYNNKDEKYELKIFIEPKYRNQGFGYSALNLMLEYVFEVMNLDAIYEEFPLSRTFGKEIYQRIGFSRLDNQFINLTKKDYLIQQKEQKKTEQDLSR